MELGEIVDVGDVYACNEAMTNFLDESRYNNDNEVSRLFEIEIIVEDK